MARKSRTKIAAPPPPINEIIATDVVVLDIPEEQIVAGTVSKPAPAAFAAADPVLEPELDRESQLATGPEKPRFRAGVDSLHHSAPAGVPPYPGLWPEDSLEAIVANGFAIGMIQADAEALAFARFVQEQKPRVIVALGTLCGGMDYVMDRMAKPELQASLDMPWEQRDPLPCWPNDLLKSVLPDLVEIIGDIHNPAAKAALVKVLNGRKVDLILQDSDHSTAGSMQDFLDYSPLVRPGGFFCFHDVRNGHGTQATYDRLCQSGYSHHEFLAAAGAIFGIGVIHL